MQSEHYVKFVKQITNSPSSGPIVRPVEEDLGLMKDGGGGGCVSREELALAMNRSEEGNPGIN